VTERDSDVTMVLESSTTRTVSTSALPVVMVVYAGLTNMYLFAAVCAMRKCEMDESNTMTSFDWHLAQRKAAARSRKGCTRLEASGSSVKRA